jgi:ATP-dependent RNA helicase SUPV3L1/SUV3
MAEYLGEPLTHHRLERHTPIEAEPGPLSLHRIEPGTALIAFSRRDVLALKAELETRFRVAVIYGNLTPEVRREEARRFRSGEAQVVVSTDAIAMGLNLPIRTVCFSTLQKWNGREESSSSRGRSCRSAAARAGSATSSAATSARWTGGTRRGSRSLRAGLRAAAAPLATTVRPGRPHRGDRRGAAHAAAGPRAGRVPARHDVRLAAALARRARRHDRARRDRRPAPPDPAVADRLTLSCAPVDNKLNWLVDEYADVDGRHTPRRARQLGTARAAFTKERAANDEELQAAEMEAKRLTLYAWLGFRYPATFPDIDECTAQRRRWTASSSAAWPNRPWVPISAARCLPRSTRGASNRAGPPSRRFQSHATPAPAANVRR